MVTYNTGKRNEALSGSSHTQINLPLIRSASNYKSEPAVFIEDVCIGSVSGYGPKNASFDTFEDFLKQTHDLLVNLNNRVLELENVPPAPDPVLDYITLSGWDINPKNPEVGTEVTITIGTVTAFYTQGAPSVDVTDRSNYVIKLGGVDITSQSSKTGKTIKVTPNEAGQLVVNATFEGKTTSNGPSTTVQGKEVPKVKYYEGLQIPPYDYVGQPEQFKSWLTNLIDRSTMTKDESEFTSTSGFQINIPKSDTTYPVGTLYFLIWPNKYRLIRFNEHGTPSNIDPETAYLPVTPDGYYTYTGFVNEEGVRTPTLFFEESDEVVTPKVLQSIKASGFTTSGTKYINEQLTINIGTVTASYSNGSSEAVTDWKYEVKQGSTTLTSGTNNGSAIKVTPTSLGNVTMTISYTEGTVTKSVDSGMTANITEKPKEDVLSEITQSGWTINPTTAYTGDTITITKGTIIAHYTVSPDTDVTSKATIKIAQGGATITGTDANGKITFSSANTGAVTITAEYSDSKGSASVTIGNVTINAKPVLNDLALSGWSVPATGYTGKTITVTKGTVTAKYTNGGADKTITNYTIEITQGGSSISTSNTFSTNNAGDVTVTVKYTEDGKTVSKVVGTCKVSVPVMTSIALSGWGISPAQCFPNNPVQITVGTVTAVYNSGDEKNVSGSETIVVKLDSTTLSQNKSGNTITVTPTTTGVIKVTVTYSDGTTSKSVEQLQCIVSEEPISDVKYFMGLMDADSIMNGGLTTAINNNSSTMKEDKFTDETNGVEITIPASTSQFPTGSIYMIVWPITYKLYQFEENGTPSGIVEDQYWKGIDTKSAPPSGYYAYHGFTNEENPRKVKLFFRQA